MASKTPSLDYLTAYDIRDLVAEVAALTEFHSDIGRSVTNAAKSVVLVYCKNLPEASSHARRSEDSRTAVMSLHARTTNNEADAVLLAGVAPKREHDAHVFAPGVFYERKGQIFSPNL